MSQTGFSITQDQKQCDAPSQFTIDSFAIQDIVRVVLPHSRHSSLLKCHSHWKNFFLICNLNWFSFSLRPFLLVVWATGRFQRQPEPLHRNGLKFAGSSAEQSWTQQSWARNLMLAGGHCVNSTLQKQLRKTSRRSHTDVCCHEGFIRKSDPGTWPGSEQKPLRCGRQTPRFRITSLDFQLWEMLYLVWKTEQKPGRGPLSYWDQEGN